MCHINPVAERLPLGGINFLLRPGVAVATYMLSYRFSPEDQNEAIKRFMEGSALEDPEGVTTVSRWHAASGGRGWLIVQADDPKSITDRILDWSDIMRYEVIPVLDDEELGELFAKHGFG